ncbi:7 alpha-cephem-methoxylase [Penicillium brevicompactum]|uniref:7 alpha-cephem-methoxylase n=1 Tax=Penicillium brevicompactum TaxID=5074 RepID=A0A9W9R1K2_PENBR|nr:7 alpha-cephem-methoxylase [Penicillium brevicompactum]
MSTTAIFSYIKWDSKFEHEKPYFMLMDCPDDFPQRNYESEEGPTEIVHDLRGQFEKFNLDDHGFVATTQQLVITDFNEETVNKSYLPSLEQLVRDVVGIRSSNPEKTYVAPGVDVKLDDKGVILHPIQSAHVDQSEFAATQRVKHHMGSRADELLKRRFRILK